MIMYSRFEFLYFTMFAVDITFLLGPSSSIVPLSLTAPDAHSIILARLFSITAWASISFLVSSIALTQKGSMLAG